MTQKMNVWLGALIIIIGGLLLFFETSSPEPLSEKEAVNLAFKLSQSLSHLQIGGTYEEGEYQNFIFENKPYRYLSSSIDTENEWLQYLRHTMTGKGAQDVFNGQNLILHDGKLAQVEADGGSLLEWDKSSAVLTSQSQNTAVYNFQVPLGETGETESFQVTFVHENKSGWRISKLPITFE